ncbi:MAG TPA: STELLO glycosyltransferase family protein [Sedimentisphaerales bacterium]|nr:STELLO glycosyltransferase family protein [Sedimentisphaerales bacterium]
MKDKISVVVTSIAAPNNVLRGLARGCVEKGYYFVVIGDEASPGDFHIDGCDFYSLARQRQTDLKFARMCPTRHYARKNIGYLLAILNGASIIIETDDDNIPYPEFWARPQRAHKVPVVKNAGWLNVYRYFSEENIWPRGFPLERVKEPAAAYASLAATDVDCPIQQGLSDGNPDVDAVYRFALPLPQTFRKDRRVGLGEGSWCPFNSQNTVWWADVFKLLYLPSLCSFRMTDIWRSFIAQRIARLNGWTILFREPTVRQERNEHNLLRDFNDEIPGYLHNGEICEALEALPLEAGVEKTADSLKLCYEKLISMSVTGCQEAELLDAWLEDIERLLSIRG